MKHSNEASSIRLITFLLITAGILAAAIIWVPDMWAFPYPLVTRISMGLVVLVAVSLASWQWTLAESDSKTGYLSKTVSSRMSWALIAGTLTAAALWPMHTFFYGDGGLLIPQIYKMAMGEPYQYDLLLNAKSSPLAGITIIGLSHAIPDMLLALGLPLPETGVYPFTWLSIIALAGLMAGIVAFTEKSRRLVTILFVFGCAGTLFYFGYVEYYTLAYTAIALYLITSERALRHGTSVFFPALFFVIAVASHYESLALIPSLTFLLMATAGHEDKFRLKALAIRSGIVIGLGIAAYFILGFYASDNRIVMPLLPVSNPSGTQTYTLLSTAHLRDMFNMLLLLAPVQLFIIVSMVFRNDRGKLFGSITGRYYLLAFFYFFVFLFFANTSLGLARDWDIGAPLGLIISLGALALLMESRKTKAAGAPLPFVYSGIAAVFLAGGWISLNVVPQYAAQRFETLLSLDSDKMYRDYAHSGYEALRKYYRNAGNDTKDIELSKTKVELLGYPQDYLYLIDKSLQIAASDRQQFIDLQTWVLSHLQAKARKLNASGENFDYSISISQIDSLAEVIAANVVPLGAYQSLQPRIAAVAAETGAEQPYGIVLAYDAYNKKQYSEAADMFQHAVDLGFHNPAIFRLLATALALQQRNSEALAALEYGIDNYPNAPNLLYTYADWLLKAGIRPGDARRALEQAAVFATNPQMREQIAQLRERAIQAQNQP